MFQPCLKVAGAGLNDGARVEAVCGEPGEGWLVEVIEDGEAMFARRAEVDVRAALVVALEPGKLLENGGGGNIVEAGEHTSVAEDAEIVERGFYGGDQIGNGRLNPVHGDRPLHAGF